MPRSTYERRTCKDCGRHREEVGHVTWRGYCEACGNRRAREQQDQMHDHSGPYFEVWRQRVAASVGATLDEPRESA